MKQLVLGDMHGRFDCVRAIYEREQPDSVVMLGDYVDSHEPISDMDQYCAVFELLDLRDKHNESGRGEFTLLIGNHDFHYLYGDPLRERYTQWDDTRVKWANDVFNMLVERDVLKAVHIDKEHRTVFSHAGITNTWLRENNLRLEDINPLLKSDLEPFRFYRYGQHTGYSVENSPIWVRPNALKSDMYTDEDGMKWRQVVGHTPTPQIVAEQNLVQCDTLPRQYLTIENNNYKIKEL